MLPDLDDHIPGWTPDAADDAAMGTSWMDEEVVIPEEAGKLQIRIRRRRTSADAFWPKSQARDDCTGCSLWWSAAVLAREVLRFPETFRGRRVVDLGSGCGLLGIVVGRLAREVLLTDASEAVLRNCEHNVRVNENIWRAQSYEPQREMRTQRLAWEDIVKGGPWQMDERADIVVSTDTLYGAWGGMLAEAILNVVVPGGLVLLAFAAENNLAFDDFRRAMENAGYSMVLNRRRLSIGPYCEQAGTDFIICECRREVFGRPGLHILERGDVMVYALQSSSKAQPPEERWIRQAAPKRAPDVEVPACLWWPEAPSRATSAAESLSSLEAESVASHDS
mmetsp:Transcript_86837/g.269992  ORF Transcript_86837/g.269992 Transcript_86837/m.269992 type:complete len:336 (-) Transcript_86837:19-1026(-)